MPKDKRTVVQSDHAYRKWRSISGHGGQENPVRFDTRNRLFAGLMVVFGGNLKQRHSTALTLQMGQMLCIIGLG